MRLTIEDGLVRCPMPRPAGCWAPIWMGAREQRLVPNKAIPCDECKGCDHYDGTNKDGVSLECGHECDLLLELLRKEFALSPRAVGTQDEPALLTLLMNLRRKRHVGIGN